MSRATSAMRHFPYFLAVAEELNFQRASVRLAIAQSALSRRIADLERDLGGVLLFERGARGVRLTPSGQILFDDVRRILGDVDESLRRVRGAADGVIGSLGIGFAEGLVRRALLPRALRGFRTAYPGVGLRLSALTSEVQRERLRSGEIDAGFVYEEDSDLAEFTLSPIGVDAVVAVVPVGHALSSAAVTLASLAAGPLIFPSRPHSPRLFDRIIAAFAAADLSPQIAAEVPSIDVAYGLVAAGLGVGLVVASADTRVPDDILLRPIADLALPIRLSMIRRRGDANAVLANFAAVIEREVAG